MAVDDQPRLGCGRLVDDVWDHAAWPADAHELTCPFCTDARARLVRLSAATEQLKHHDQTNADLQISTSVKTAIMNIARAEVRRARHIPLEQPPAGQVASPLLISEQAVAAVVRAAADTVRGVRARRCAVDIDKAALLEPHDPPQPAAIHVNLRIAVSAATIIPEAMVEVRQEISRLLADRVGLDVTSIHIDVEDLYDA